MLIIIILHLHGIHFNANNVSFTDLWYFLFLESKSIFLCWILSNTFAEFFFTVTLTIIIKVYSLDRE